MILSGITFFVKVALHGFHMRCRLPLSRAIPNQNAYALGSHLKRHSSLEARGYISGAVPRGNVHTLWEQGLTGYPNGP